MSAPDALHTLLLPRLEMIRKVPSGYQARCPAHEDNNPSLSISPGKTQPIVLNCHAGCTSDAILTALGLRWDDISAPREDKCDPNEVWTPAGPASDVYDYHDEKGTLLFQVLRIPQPGGKKTFRQRVPDELAKSGWRWRLDDTRRVPYRLPELLRATEAGETVYVVEGERDVHSLLRAGVTATCNPQGAGKWQPEFSGFLVDAHVKIVADKDKPGQAHARTVAENLDGVSASVTILEPAEGKDVTDHLNAGKTLDELLVTWATDTAAAVDLAPDIHVFLSEPDPPQRWVIPDLLEHGDRLIWTGLEGLGKALDVDTPVATPTGWSTMGALTVGDHVYAPDGTPTAVVAATEVMHDRPCYRVTFSDGAELVADENHLWLTETLRARETAAKAAARPTTVQPRGTDQRHKRRHWPAVVTTGHIRDTLKARGVVNNHSIAATAPIDGPDVDLPVAPYTLGIWLGDGITSNGALTLNRADSNYILNGVTGEGYAWHHVPSMQDENCVGVRPEGLFRALRLAGFLGHKHVPTEYLRASAAQRWALLAGLMDTDGHIDSTAAGKGRGHGAALCELTLTNKTLAADALELILSLGIKATSHESDAKIDGRVVGRRWRITFQSPTCPFTLPRQVARWEPLRTRRAQLRYITSVEPTEAVPVRCIQVDRPDGMFLAGERFIPTHNSLIIRTLAVAAAAGLHPFRPESFPPQRVLYIDCENSERQGRKKFRPIEEVARLKNHRIADDTMFLIHRPAGIDLSREVDAAWLLERVRAHRPDLLVCGPFYRLHDSESEEERSARKVVKALDDARVIADCAVIVEHHSPHAQGGGARSVRPFGSSLLMRWPEMGMGIVPNSEEWPCRNVKVIPFRGNRDERDWPRALRWDVRDGEWPWTVDTSGIG